MAAMSWNSDFHPCLRVSPFIVLGAMISEKASCLFQLTVKLIVLHTLKELFCLFDNAKVAKKLYTCKLSYNNFVTIRHF
jgi:hypothetical protein